jgi:DNA-binding HxlR family transcriptional regulator
MRFERSENLTATEEQAQRAVVLQILRSDHHERWSQVELEREIVDIQPKHLSEALQALAKEGVLHRHGELIVASRAARRLDELGMVSI